VSKVIQAGEFFVVGGPVQPERPCYVERAADHVLETTIRAQRFSFVLGPRAIGKSSLMGRVAKALRRANELAAVVDLAQIDARGDSADSDRWLFSIAHRIVHELRIKVDLAAWWNEKRALSEHRLLDFFWEIVLTNSTAPVTIFFDEIERARDLTFSAELFAAIRACYSRRKNEPDYARLNFVVLGVAHPAELCPDADVSPFTDGQAVELSDFDAAQTYQLALGFGGEPAQTQALMDRICIWTGGHPYLTQKVARGVARKDERLEDVERVVKEQLLAPAQEEPLLGHIATLLRGRSPASRQALKVLRKLAHGAKVRAREDSVAQRQLLLAGLVRVDQDAQLQYRNRVLKEAFGARWLKAARPAGARIAASLLVLAIAAGIGAYWYHEYLPRPYVRALTAEPGDLAQLTSAYRDLRRFPGFTSQADELFAAALERRGGAAASFGDIDETQDALRNLLGRDALADRLLTEFWLRESLDARNAERRADALLYALKALPTEAARSVLAELIGDDYRQLERNFSGWQLPTEFAVDWVERRVVGIDGAAAIQALDLSPRAGGVNAEMKAARFSALEYRALQRELTVASSGSAGEFDVTLELQHANVNDLLVTLVAPSGAEANVIIPQGEPALVLSFTAAGSSTLAALADEDREGIWRLKIVDRRAGDAGTLLAWALRFAADEEPVRDAPEGGVEIEDPLRTEDVTVDLGANGRFAIVRPMRAGSVGTVAVWDLRAGALQGDLQLPAPATYAELNADASRLLTVSGGTLSVWNVAEGVPIAQLATQTEFVLPPALSPDGAYVMIAERVDEAAPLFSLLRAADGELLTSVDGVEGVSAWFLGSEARYVALLGDAGGLVALDPRRGGQPQTLPHARAIVRVVPLATAATLLTVDARGDVRVWELDAAAEATPKVLGTTVDPASVSVATAGARVAYAVVGSRVVVWDGSTGGAQILSVEPSSSPPTTRLSPDGGSLLTAAGSDLQLWQLAQSAAPTVAARGAELAEVSALALDRDGELVAVGFRNGFVRAQNRADLDVAPIAPRALDYFGHRGAVRAVAVDARNNVVVSGGADDATVRTFDAVSLQPSGIVLRPSGGAIDAVALSDDGRLIASATPTSVRLWRAADGISFAEIVLDDARASALAFSPDNRWLAVGDEGGGVGLHDSASGSSGDATAFVQPVRWLGFNANGERLFVATEHWLHDLRVAPGRLETVNSRLRSGDLQPLAAARDVADRLHVLRGRLAGALAFGDLLFDSPPAPLATDAFELTKDWTHILQRRVADDGSIVALSQ
jgi:subtilisin-like proprotein convertase family protein/WD40 repeat protein